MRGLEADKFRVLTRLANGGDAGRHRWWRAVQISAKAGVNQRSNRTGLAQLSRLSHFCRPCLGLVSLFYALYKSPLLRRTQDNKCA